MIHFQILYSKFKREIEIENREEEIDRGSERKKEKESERRNKRNNVLIKC